MYTPISNSDALRIGSVESVSPDEISVLLDIEAPNDVALNTGTPRPFPRIHSYVLIPSDNGFLVAQVEWIKIERSQFPKRKGVQDFGVIDLPYPLRMMYLNPLGVLKAKDDVHYEFSRGIEVFPTVGDPVLIPTNGQLRGIVESGNKRPVKIGVAPLAANSSVNIDPDRLFGRHLAVLGNTGSGKSCSVAGLIRWSIEAAQAAKKAKSDAYVNKDGDFDPEIDNYQFSDMVDAHFIILDPNGEYSNAFSGIEGVKITRFAVQPISNSDVKQLQTPIWLWNSSEWCSFAKTSARAQRPTLIQALRSVRSGELNVCLSPGLAMRRYLQTIFSIIAINKQKGDPWAAGQANFGRRKGFYDGLLTWRQGLTIDTSFSAEESSCLNALIECFDNMIALHNTGGYPTLLFSLPQVNEILAAVSKAHMAFGGNAQDTEPVDADIPQPFKVDMLLKSIEANSELMRTSEHIETMLIRIRALLTDYSLKQVTGYGEEISLDQWLSNYVTPSKAEKGSINIIDLSLVPAEIISIITSVVARMTLEALQRYRKMNNGKTLPTVLVMEEAHTFIKRYSDRKDPEEETSASEMCTRVFEKIAREGRKFGLGLLLSSQRPSELSPTVLSQCNTFLIHRITNDVDQELIKKLVPDNLRGLLRDLPSLPSQYAVLLGWASELPVLVKMRSLKKEHQPDSKDPDFWNVWTTEKREVDWKKIADDWQKGGCQVSCENNGIDMLQENDPDQQHE